MSVLCLSFASKCRDICVFLGMRVSADTLTSAAKRRFLAALRSLKPNCVNHGLCVGDIKPPYASPASPAGLNTHGRGTAHTHTHLKGTFPVVPFIYNPDDGRSVICYSLLLQERWIPLCHCFTGWRHLFYGPFSLWWAPLWTASIEQSQTRRNTTKPHQLRSKKEITFNLFLLILIFFSGYFLL